MAGLNRSATEIRTIDVERPIIARELLTARDVSCCFTDLNLMNRCSGDRSDAFGSNPPVDEVVVANLEVVDDRGVVVNLCYLRCSDAKAVWVRITKMPDRHERETIHIQTKVESNADGGTVIKEPNAFPVHRARRQRRPAAVIVRIPPGHP